MESRTAITKTRTTSEPITDVNIEPNSERMIRAKISSGIDSMTSTRRDRIVIHDLPADHRPEAHHDADREGQNGGHKGDADGGPRAVDDARQQVAADLVGAQPAWAPMAAHRVADDLRLAIRRDPGPEDRHQDEEAHDDDADPGGDSRLVSEDAHLPRPLRATAASAAAD